MTDHDRIKQMAMDAGFPSMCVENMSLLDRARLTAFAALVAEDCARVCDEAATPPPGEVHTDAEWCALHLSAAIRARYPLHSEAEPG